MSHYVTLCHILCHSMLVFMCLTLTDNNIYFLAHVLFNHICNLLEWKEYFSVFLFFTNGKGGSRTLHKPCQGKYHLLLQNRCIIKKQCTFILHLVNWISVQLFKSYKIFLQITTKVILWKICIKKNFLVIR